MRPDPISIEEYIRSYFIVGPNAYRCFLEVLWLPLKGRQRDNISGLEILQAGKFIGELRAVRIEQLEFTSGVCNIVNAEIVKLTQDVNHDCESYEAVFDSRGWTGAV